MVLLLGGQPRFLMVRSVCFWWIALIVTGTDGSSFVRAPVQRGQNQTIRTTSRLETTTTSINDKNTLLQDSTTRTTTTLLPVGDVNLLVVTDVHSWVAGHNVQHEPYWNVDYGTLLSFYETLQAQIPNLVLVMNGDFMDGTGLGLHVDRLFPILERMPFAALNLGNHEVLRNDHLQAMRDKGFLDHWQGTYLTSNTLWTDTRRPIGHRYTYLTVPQSQSQSPASSSSSSRPNTVLVFGFLYNMKNACSAATVERVQDVVQQEWFRTVLLADPEQEAVLSSPEQGSPTTTPLVRPYHAILVLAHMDYQDPLLDVIRRAIRTITQNDQVPIQFLAGHSQVRGHAVLDEWSTVVEAGHFLDTIGFVSFPTLSSPITTNNKNHTVQQQQELLEDEDDTVPDVDEEQSLDSNTTMANDPSLGTNTKFRHVFLDANEQVLRNALFGGSGVDGDLDSSSNNTKTASGTSVSSTDFSTGRGRALSHFIQGTRLSMGLTQIVGCSGGPYSLSLPLDDPRSLWGLYVREVLPHALQNNRSRILVQRTRGSLRYDLFTGPITVDDAIAISPMHDRIVRVLDRVETLELLTLLHKLQVSAPDDLYPHLPRYAIAPWPHPLHGRPLHTFELYTMESNWPAIQQALMELSQVDNSSWFATDWTTFSPSLYRLGKKCKSIQTSHGVWVDFFQDKWPCQFPNHDGTNNNNNNNGDDKFNQQLLIWLCVLTALMGVAHYYSWLYQHHHPQDPSNHEAFRTTERSRNYIRMAGVTARRRRHHHHYYNNNNSKKTPSPPPGWKRLQVPSPMASSTQKEQGSVMHADKEQEFHHHGGNLIASSSLSSSSSRSPSPTHKSRRHRTKTNKGRSSGLLNATETTVLLQASPREDDHRPSSRRLYHATDETRNS